MYRRMKLKKKQIFEINKIDSNIKTKESVSYIHKHGIYGNNNIIQTA